MSKYRILATLIIVALSLTAMACGGGGGDGDQNDSGAGGGNSTDKVDPGGDNTQKETEPNNSLAEGNSAGTGLISGNLDTDNDIFDYFRFRVPSDGIYRFVVTTPGSADGINLRLKNVADTSVILSEGGIDDIQDVGMEEGQEIMVRVRADTLGPDNSNGEYQIALNRLKTSNQFEQEPNDSMQQGNNLNLGTMSGNLDTNIDPYDYFIFSVPSDGTYRFSVASPGNNDAVNLRLKDTENTSVILIEGGIGNNLDIGLLEAMQIMVRVRADAFEVDNSAGEYSITANKIANVVLDPKPPSHVIIEGQAYNNLKLFPDCDPCEYPYFSTDYKVLAGGGGTISIWLHLSETRSVQLRTSGTTPNTSYTCTGPAGNGITSEVNYYFNGAVYLSSADGKDCDIVFTEFNYPGRIAGTFRARYDTWIADFTGSFELYVD